MWRRDGRRLLRCAAPLLALLILAALAAALALAAAGADGAQPQPLRVAVVDGEDSLLSRIFIQTVENAPLVTGLLSAEPMTEAAALASLDAGETAAVVLLPEGTVARILAGEAARGTVLLTPRLAEAGETVQAVVRLGETILTAGQCGVFAAETVMDEANTPAAARAAVNAQINADLLHEALDSPRYFSAETLDYAGTGLGRRAFLAAAWSAAALCLLSAALTPLFAADANAPLLSRLRAAGIGAGRFLAPKLAWSAAVRALVLALLLWIFTRLGWISPAPSGLLCALCAAVYLSVLGAAIGMAGAAGAPIAFLFAGAGLFLVGALIPRTALPPLLLALGDASPFGAAVSLLAPAFSPAGALPGLAAWAPAAVYAALGLAAAVLRVRRIREGGGYGVPPRARQAAAGAGRLSYLGLAWRRTWRGVRCPLLLAALTLAIAAAGRGDAAAPMVGYADAARSPLSADVAARLSAIGMTEYPDADALRAAVRAGRADCGFVLGEGLEADAAGAVTVLTSPASAAAELSTQQAASAVFAARAPHTAAASAAAAGLDGAKIVAAYRALEARGARFTFDVAVREGGGQTPVRAADGAAAATAAAVGLLALSLFTAAASLRPGDAGFCARVGARRALLCVSWPMIGVQTALAAAAAAAGLALCGRAAWILPAIVYLLGAVSAAVLLVTAAGGRAEIVAAVSFFVLLLSLLLSPLIPGVSLLAPPLGAAASLAPVGRLLACTAHPAREAAISLSLMALAAAASLALADKKTG